MAPRYQFIRFPEGKLKAVTFSYDDGVIEDIKLADIFSKYGMKATFNINSAFMGKNERKLTPDEIKEHVFDRGHEIATHGAEHRAPLKQRPIMAIQDTLNCRLGLEEAFGTIIRGMAYPDSGIREWTPASATYEEVKSYLKALGIAYARTLGEDNDSFMLPDDFYAWMPTAHHNNPEIFEYIDKFVGLDEDKLWHTAKMPRLFYIWGHSYEFEREGNWERIEEICERLGGKEDTWYATNIEICDYVRAYESLVYSADGNKVYNPTLIDVWFWAADKIYEVKSGETVILG